MPPTQYPLSGKAAPPPNSRDAFPSLQQGADPLGWAQGDPRELQGTQGYLRAPSAPLGGDGPTGPLGVIPKPFRMEPVSIEWLLRNHGWKAVWKERFQSTTKTFRRSGWPRVRNNAQKVHGQHWARNNQNNLYQN